MERRHSTTSDSSNDSRQNWKIGGIKYAPRYSLGDVDTMAGRVGKTLPPKVATNPLQFVKVGPCDLYRSAQEQLKKVEEIKKAKKVQRDDVEDWQSNLDNWKCSRRKRQEHIIERVVEVKKFELEEHERNRKKSKTFSEMMEDRNRQGRKASLPVYHNDEDDDLSELGLTSHKTGSSDSASNADQASSTDGETTSKDETVGDETREKSPKELKKSKQNSPSPPSPNESQEYTYEWAIQNYVNFAENRVKSKSTTNILDEHRKSNGREYPPIATKPVSTAKAENYLKSIDKNRSSPEEKKSIVAAVPKVDISGRRLLFEKMQGAEESQKTQRTCPEISRGKKIKDRLSFLEEQKKQDSGHKDSKLNGFPSEPLVKNRLMNIESISSNNGQHSKKTVEAITSISIKDRLNSLSKPDLSSSISTAKTIVEPSTSIKDRLNSLHSSIAKETSKTAIEIPTNSIENKSSHFKDDGKFDKDDKEYERSLSPDDINKRQDRHFRHRSLDSLDIDQENAGSSSGSFERVQSLEDLDYRNYPPSTFSGDTDREDSGIHTADVSSSVSQADDYDLHLDGTIVDPHQPSIAEEVRSVASPFQKFQDSTTPSAVSPTPSPSVEDAAISIAATSATTTTATTSSLSSTPAISLSSSSNSSKPQPPSSPNNTNNSSFSPPHSGLSNLPSIPEVANIPEIKTSVYNEPTENIQSDLEPVDDESSVSWTNFDNPVANSTLLRTSVAEFFPEELDVTVIPSSQLQGANVEELCREFINEESKCDPGLSASSDSPTDRRDPLPIHHEPTEQITEKYPLRGETEDIDEPSQHSANEENQFKGVVMNLYSETPQDVVFNLNPKALEPPKEKPPPPPTELSDEEAPSQKPQVSLRRLDSTKRIKKEIRQKRSSFLGIEGGNDDSYLEPELELVRPPDMTALLAEERRMERQLYRQSICSESDSNQESRDSGVELDHKLPETWSHSRNDSEVYGNQSTTSEEDEIMKKEREIIETLEEEEKIRKQDMENKLKLGETLAMKLRELEAEKERYEWESGSIPDTYQVDQQQQLAPPQPNRPPAPEPTNQPEPLLCRPEPVSCRQEPVPRRSIEALQNVRVSHAMYTQELKRPVPPPPQQDWPMMAEEVRSRESSHMANVAVRKSLGDLRRADQLAAHRRSMPNLQEAPLVIPVQPRRPPPPPPINQNQQSITPSHPNPAAQQIINSHGGQQMTRQTLQALSAAPRSRIISNDNWQSQAKRKQPRPDNCNYQHWLIQEAEHRRITEQHQRQMDALQQQQQRSANLQPLKVPQQQQLSHAQSHPCINSSKWHNGNHTNGNPTYLVENGWSQPPVHHHPATYSPQNPPQPMQRINPPPKGKPLPDSIIQTLTQRVQRMNDNNNYARRRHDGNAIDYYSHNTNKTDSAKEKEKMLSVSGKKRCSNCGDELGRGAAMIIESLQLFYHIECFKCCVCCLQLGDGQMGTDVRVRNNKLHCHNCYSSDDGAKFSCV